MPALQERGREVQHLGDVVGGVRILVGWLNAHRGSVLQEGLRVLLGDLLGGEALVGHGDVHSVPSLVGDVVGHVAHVGDVHDLGDLVSLELEGPPHEIGQQERPEVSDVHVAVHRGAAGIHTDPSRLDWSDVLDAPRQRVVETHAGQHSRARTSDLPAPPFGQEHPPLTWTGLA